MKCTSRGLKCSGLSVKYKFVHTFCPDQPNQGLQYHTEYISIDSSRITSSTALLAKDTSERERARLNLTIGLDVMSTHSHGERASQFPENDENRELVPGPDTYDYESFLPTGNWAGSSVGKFDLGLNFEDTSGLGVFSSNYEPPSIIDENNYYGVYSIDLSSRYWEI